MSTAVSWSNVQVRKKYSVNDSHLKNKFFYIYSWIKKQPFEAFQPCAYMYWPAFVTDPSFISRLASAHILTIADSWFSQEIYENVSSTFWHEFTLVRFSYLNFFLDHFAQIFVTHIYCERCYIPRLQCAITWHHSQENLGKFCERGSRPWNIEFVTPEPRIYFFPSGALLWYMIIW